MIYISNLESNVKVGFNILNKLPHDFDKSKSKYEKWVPFVLNISTPERVISITEDMQAYMTIHEIEKIYSGLKDLLNNTSDDKDRFFTHYSSESYFEISIEYLGMDKCFNMVLWFITAKCPEGEIVGYDAGFRFVFEKSELIKFVEEFHDRIKMVCPQCSI